MPLLDSGNPRDRGYQRESPVLAPRSSALTIAGFRSAPDPLHCWQSRAHSQGVEVGGHEGIEVDDHNR
jgi:hypothetical protein